MGKEETLVVQVEANTQKAEDQVNDFASGVEKNPLILDIKTNVEGIKEYVKEVQADLRVVEKAFARTESDINNSIKGVKFTNIQNAFIDIIKYLKDISGAFDKIDFSDFGGKGLKDLNESISDIRTSLQGLVTDLNFDKIRPTEIIQKDVDNYRKELKTVNKDANALKKAKADLNRLFKEGNKFETWDKFLDADINEKQTIIPILERIVKLGGSVDSIGIKEKIEEVDGSVVTVTHSIRELADEFAMEGVDLSKLLNSKDLKDPVEKVKQLNTLINGLNDELERARTKENRDIKVEIDTKSIEELSSAIGELKASFNISEDATLGIKTEDIEKITNGFKELKEVLDNIHTLLSSLDFSKISNIKNTSPVDKNGLLSDSVVTPTQQFDNEIQQNLVMLKNYENTIKEIDNLKINPETEEIKQKLKELNKLADYFASQITVIRSENGHEVNRSMMYFNGVPNNNLMEHYSVDDIKRFTRVAEERSGLNRHTVSKDFVGIEEELSRIEQGSENLRNSLTKELTVSKTYVKKIKSNLIDLVDTYEELQHVKEGSKDYELYRKDIETFSKRTPEVLQLLDKLKTYEQAYKFVNTDEWNDFLATLPQAHAYLESIGYDFNSIKQTSYETPVSLADEQIEKLQKEEKQAEETREEIQKLNEERKENNSSNVTRNVSDKFDEEKQKVNEVVESEKAKFNELENVIGQTIPEAIQKKNDAFQNEGDIVDEVIGGEVQKFKELGEQLDTLPQKIKSADLSSIGKATKITSQLSVLENISSPFESAITEYIADLDKLQDKSQKAQQSIKEVIKASAKNDNAGNALETISNELNKLNETVYASPDEIKASQEEYRKYLELREKALAEGRNQAKQVDIQSNINSGEYSKQVDEVANKFKAWGATTETINEKLAEVRKSLKELNSAPIEKQVEAEKQFNVALKEANAEQKKYRSEMANSKNVAKWYKSIANWTNQNSAATKKYGAELKGMMNNLQNATEMSRTELDGIVKQFLRIQAEANRTGATGKSFFDQLSSRARSLTQYLMTYVSFYDVIRVGRDVVDTIKTLDDELVDLSKTTTMSTSDMNAFYYEANDIAKQMGVTTQEIISQSSAWSRLGYNTKQTSEEMAKLSSQFASISPGMGTEKAQEGLVSIMKAFDIPVDEVKDKILNSINTLGNNFAESNQDIVEGMERSAAALAAVGTSFEDSIALFTGGQEVLQDAEKMGTALRSISMRIRSYNETSEEYDEELKNITGDLIDLTKTAEHSQGISVFKEGSTTEFKSLVDYLGEVSEIWDEMTDKQKNDYLQKAFAKTQAQSGAAILGNFDQVREALNKIEESSGSADAEMEKVTSSISYKMNELSETWTGTWQKLLDRGDLGSVVEMLTSLSEGLGFVIDKLGILGTLGLGTGAILGAKDIGRSKMFDLTFSNV